MIDYKEIANFGAVYSEAVIASANAAKAGAEKTSMMLSEIARDTYELSVNAGKTVVGVKTPGALLAAQTQFVNESLGHAVASGTNLATLGVEVMGEMVHPFAAQAKDFWSVAAKAA